MREVQKLNCEIVKDLLPLYCEDLVSEVSREAVETHLQSCQICEELYRQMREELFTAQMPEVLEAEVKPLKKNKTNGKSTDSAGVSDCGYCGGASFLGTFCRYGSYKSRGFKGNLYSGNQCRCKGEFLHPFYRIYH